MAEHLLDEWCWIRTLHPDTVDRRDYSTFRLSAWCSQPEKIPAAMELVIVKPPAPVVRSLMTLPGSVDCPTMSISSWCWWLGVLRTWVHLLPHPCPAMAVVVAGDGSLGLLAPLLEARGTGLLPEATRLVSWGTRSRSVGAAAREPRWGLPALRSRGPRRLRILLLPHATHLFPRKTLKIWRPPSLFHPLAWEASS